MQDLNDKVTGNSLLATEWNQVPSEIQNVIEGLGIVLSSGDLNQLGKAIAGYVTHGNETADSGAANAYVLTPTGTKQAAPALVDGLLLNFIPGNDNTGASTVNYAGLGVVPLTFADGTALPAGILSTTQGCIIRYDATGGGFWLVGYTEDVSFQSSALQNGWTGTADYTRLRDLTSVFKLTVASAGTITNGTIVFTMPAGYRPGIQQIAFLAHPTGGSNGAAGYVRILTGGSVDVQAVPSALTNIATTTAQYLTRG